MGQGSSRAGQQSGTRPQFAVVTGVSTGALMAIYAFAGPKYDEELHTGYTTVTASDIFEVGATPESLDRHVAVAPADQQARDARAARRRCGGVSQGTAVVRHDDKSRRRPHGRVEHGNDRGPWRRRRRSSCFVRSCWHRPVFRVCSRRSTSRSRPTDASSRRCMRTAASTGRCSSVPNPTCCRARPKRLPATEPLRHRQRQADRRLLHAAT